MMAATASFGTGALAAGRGGRLARQRHVADHTNGRMLGGVGRRLVLGSLFRLLVAGAARELFWARPRRIGR